MARKDTSHNPDPSENAAFIVAESTAATTGDVEAVWPEWSSDLQNVDEQDDAS